MLELSVKVDGLVKKLATVEQHISAIKGKFFLFALLLREESTGTWDVLVAAPWIANQQDAMKYLADEIQSALTPEELVLLSKIVILEPGSSLLAAFQLLVSIEHGNVSVTDCTINGLVIQRAFIVTSQRL